MRGGWGCETVGLGNAGLGHTVMNTPDQGFDYPRYIKLLAEAVDEPKRLALINLLIEEHARDRLAAHEAQRSSEMIRSLIASRLLQDDGRRRAYG